MLCVCLCSLFVVCVLAVMVSYVACLNMCLFRLFVSLFASVVWLVCVCAAYILCVLLGVLMCLFLFVWVPVCVAWIGSLCVCLVGVV